MSVVNPSNLYRGDAAIVNTQPATNMYIQLLAKQQAKHEAMDNYERSRINSVNDAGLRDDDRKTFDDGLADLQSYYNANKSLIQKGNTQAAFDYEKKFRNVKDIVAQSKDRGLRHSAAMKFYNDRLKADQRLPDDFLQELHQNDMPVMSKIIDPSTGEEKEPQPFDLTKWSNTPKPFNQQNYIKEFSDIKRTPAVRYEDVPNQPLRRNEITEETFDDGAKTAIATRALENYNNSYSFSDAVKKAVADPISRQRLTDLFKQEYKKDPTTLADYATAQTLDLLQPKVTKTKTVDNKEAKDALDFSQAKTLAGIHQGYTVANQLRGFYHTDNKTVKDQHETNQWIDSYIDNGISESKKVPAINGYRTVAIDPVTAKALTKGNVQPTAMQVSEDGNTFVPLYPTYDVKGNPTNVPNVALSTPMSREGIKLALGYKTLSKKELGNTMKGGNTNTQTNKVHNVVETKGKSGKKIFIPQ